MKNFFQKGVSLYLSIMVLSIILAIVLGLATILVGQIKMIRGIGDSVIAFYYADTGIEMALKEIQRWENGESSLNPEYGDANKDPGYFVNIKCCQQVDGGRCTWTPGNECPLSQEDVDPSCHAPRFCIKSSGTYNGIKRAIEVKL